MIKIIALIALLISVAFACLIADRNQAESERDLYKKILQDVGTPCQPKKAPAPKEKR